MAFNLRFKSGSTSNLDLAGNPIPSGATFKALTITYYDNYNFTQKSYDNADNSKLDAGTNYSPFLETLPSTSSQLTKGSVTGNKVWVLEDPSDLSVGKWLEAVSYYDDKGRVIQSQADNFKGGLQKATNLFDFTSKIICSYTWLNNPASSIGAVRIKTNMRYDHAGRLLSITKQLNDDMATSKIILQNEYDELGQLRNKKLGTDPVNTSQPLESLAYDYNIRGWLTGINKDYANNISSTNYFGQVLNYDYGFSNKQYNGNIAGLHWRSKGDGEQRAYGFAYDAANRILKADFSQNTGGWNQSAGVNFNMQMGDGSNPTTAYDANGNIKNMQQWGLKLIGSSQIDNLTYSYFDKSNKLQAVGDGITSDNKLGDFTDKNTGATDYGYDVNGNLITDLNKRINGSTGIDQTTGGAITYNHLNLPSVITVKNDNGSTKGTITYLYDATGNKLQKTTVDNSVSPAKTTTTSYIAGFVYENDGLQFMTHEEGRIRYKAATNSYAFDYFLKDHLGNVRSVLTDEIQQDAYPPASMELAQSSIENSLYGNIDATRSDKPAGYPGDTYTNPNDKVAKTNGSGNKIGPSIILKVMAGDKFNFRVNSWYKLNGSTPGTPVNPITELLSALTSGIASVSAGKVTIDQLNSAGVVSPGVLSFLNNRGSNGSKPKAFVNWVLLDEQFNIVLNNSSAEQVGDDNESTVHTHVRNDMPVDKNGYLYIYVSNETPNIDVLFDNLQVTHVRGPILEETHYYPFGLVMNGISSKAFGKLENKKKYNGIEFDTDLDLNEYEANFRDLDPQTGRWWQIDPKIDNMEAWSPYASNYDNPIKFADPLGDEPETLDGGPGPKLIQASKEIYQIYKGLEAGKSLLNVARDVHAGDILGLLQFDMGGQLNKDDLQRNGPTAMQGTSSTLPLADVAVLLAKAMDVPKERVVNQKTGEKAQNQLEGIEKKQAKEKKNAASQGLKQNKINSIKKSQQGLQNALKKIKNLKDVNDHF